MDLTRVNLDGVRNIHLMGIGGAGMSGLALLLKELGYEVSGCDVSWGPYADKVRKAQIDFNIGHNSEHLERYRPDLLVYSSAIPEDNEELLSAADSGIWVVKRAQMLGAIFNKRYGIGVAGTHGKTTTSSMIGLVLGEAGLDPTVAIGGELCDIGCNARLGQGPHMVAELDESDGSFLNFHPSISVITNVDWDHVNYYPTFDSVVEAFLAFSKNLNPGGARVLCGEDPGVQRLIEAMDKDSSIITYGFGEKWDWGAKDIEYNRGGGLSFEVLRSGRPLGKLTLSVSGDHNVLNSLATVAVADRLSVPFESVRESLRHFTGAKRRLQFKGRDGAIDVYDDYGHHPKEVEATIKAVERSFPGRKIFVVFQPHRYTRTAAMAEDFAKVLSRVSKVVLMPIYPADEKPIEGVSSAMIGEYLVKSGHRRFLMADSGQDAVEKTLSAVDDGDIVLTLGAGDVSEIGDMIVKGLTAKSIAQGTAVAVGA